MPIVKEGPIRPHHCPPYGIIDAVEVYTYFPYASKDCFATITHVKKELQTKIYFKTLLDTVKMSPDQALKFARDYAEQNDIETIFQRCDTA